MSLRMKNTHRFAVAAGAVLLAASATPAVADSPSSHEPGASNSLAQASPSRSAASASPATPRAHQSPASPKAASPAAKKAVKPAKSVKKAAKSAKAGPADRGPHNTGRIQYTGIDQPGALNQIAPGNTGTAVFGIQNTYAPHTYKGWSIELVAPKNTRFASAKLTPVTADTPGHWACTLDSPTTMRCQSPDTTDNPRGAIMQGAVKLRVDADAPANAQLDQGYAVFHATQVASTSTVGDTDSRKMSIMVSTPKVHAVPVADPALAAGAAAAVLGGAVYLRRRSGASTSA